MPPIGIHPTTPPQERLQGDRPRLPGRGSDERGSQSRPSLNVRQPGTPGTCQARYCGRRPSPKCVLCCAEQHSLRAVLANFLEELADRLIVADVDDVLHVLRGRVPSCGTGPGQQPREGVEIHVRLRGAYECDQERGDDLPSRGTHIGLGCYWITSSARWMRDGGIARPRALAVLRSISSLNLVGCSTGRSAGFAPLRILST